MADMVKQMSIFMRLKREVREILPAVAFFFVAFNLIVLTDNLTAWQYHVHIFSYLSATLAALVAGKVIMLTNLLPFMNVFRGRPLFHNTLWKAGLYMLAALVFQYAEGTIRWTYTHRNLAAAERHVIGEFARPRFWAVHIWGFVLLLIFVAVQELSGALGHGGCVGCSWAGNALLNRLQLWYDKQVISLAISGYRRIPLFALRRKRMVEEEVRFKTSRDLKLSGVLLAPNEDLLDVVVFAHGTGSGKSSPRNRGIAEKLLEAGIGSFLFDFTGHGDSDGLIAQSTQSQQFDDLTSALDFLDKQTYVATRFIGVHGSSTGGTVAVRAAAQDLRNSGDGAPPPQEPRSPPVCPPGPGPHANHPGQRGSSGAAGVSSNL